MNFIEGNYITTYNEHKILTEKVVESLIVSYSMNDTFSNHLESLNDFMIESIIHNCEPSNLLKYFQRNKVNSIPYESDTDYFNTCISNFFSRENLDFLHSEIIYVDNRTKNIDLRRTTENIFENLCILLAYLEIDFDKNLLEKIILFIKKLDFSIHQLSLLAHALLNKPESFKTNQILSLIKTLIDKDLTKGFLITNAIYTLKEKSYVFNKSSKNLIGSIIETAAKNPEYGILRALNETIYQDDKNLIESSIRKSLDTQFNNELFYQAIVSDNLKNPKVYINQFIESYEAIINGQPAVLFRNLSSYTGMAHKFRNPLNKLVTIIYTLNDILIIENDVIDAIKKLNPYYNFILNLDNYPISDDFNINWLLENKSKVVLNRLAKVDTIRVKLKEELSNKYQQDLGKLFIDYFVK